MVWYNTTMIKTICAVCETNRFTKELYKQTFHEKDLSGSTYSARRLPDQVHYRLVRCLKCGLIFSSPILPVKIISQLYRKSICNYNEQVPYLIQTYMQVFNKVKEQLPKNPKILEIGCGDGFFLEELWKNGNKNVFGVEPSPKMVNNAKSYIRKNITIDVFRSKQFPAKKFDVICCFHTLDHVPDPNAVVREMYRILSPKGFIIIVVHDTEGLSVKIFGEKSPIFDIEHIYLFHKSSIKGLFEKHGFSSEVVANLVNTYPLEYWFRMSGLPKTLKVIGNHILKFLRLSKVNLSLAGGNIYYIAKK